MTVFTKPAREIFAPTDAGGNARQVVNSEVQTWGTEVETAIDGVSAIARVRVVATSNVAISTGLAAGNTIDGVTLVKNDLVLLTGQTAAAENGVYTVPSSGAALRSAAFATYDSMPGVLISVMEGTANADTSWVFTSNKGGTIGTTAITVAAFPLKADEAALVAGTANRYPDAARIKASLPAVPLTVIAGQRALTMEERQYQHVYLGEYHTPGTDVDTAWAAALAEAKTYTRAILHLPPWDMPFNDTTATEIILPSTDHRLIIKGVHREVSRMIFDAAADNWLQIGDRNAANITYGVELADLGLYGAVQQTAGAAVKVEKAQRIDLSNLFVTAHFGFADFGNPNVAGDVRDIRAHGIYTSGGGAAPVFALSSGAILEVGEGCVFNGGGSTTAIFKQTNATHNWDGLKARGFTAEQCGKLLDVDGSGVSNAEFSDIIADRPTNGGQHVRLAATGTAKNIAFTGVKFQGIATANTLIAFSLSGTVDGLAVQGCDFFDVGNQVFFLADGGTYRAIRLMGNGIKDCGFNAVPLFRIATGAQIAIVGNIASAPSRAGYTYGISWEGAASNRQAAANYFFNAATGQEVGTP